MSWMLSSPEGSIVSDLKKHGLLDGARVAERHDDEAKVLWPPGFSATFAVL
jgi:hypothetical protein